MAISYKSFKSIFRIDYKSLLLLDHLGFVVEPIREQIENKLYSNMKYEINTSNYSYTAFGKFKEEYFKIHLGLNSLTTIVEDAKGIDINKLHNQNALKLADEVLLKFSEIGIKKFDRIGYRSWVVIDLNDYELNFENLKNHFIDDNSILNQISSNDDLISDVNITFEIEHASGYKSRTSFGPYHESERKRYFSADIEVLQGLILDIDISNNKIQSSKMDDVLKENYPHFCQFFNAEPMEGEYIPKQQDSYSQLQEKINAALAVFPEYTSRTMAFDNMTRTNAIFRVLSELGINIESAKNEQCFLWRQIDQWSHLADHISNCVKNFKVELSGFSQNLSQAISYSSNIEDKWKVA